MKYNKRNLFYVLIKFFVNKKSSCPIHYIQSRIKAKQSMEDKLSKKGQDISVENARDFIQDIAGIRIICYFVDDIYNLVKK